MPRYDFKCENCGNVFEKRCELETTILPNGKKDQRIKDDKVRCLKCSHLAIRQFPKNFNFQFNTIDWNYHQRDSYLN
jgi:predicted nucleic acid-binding Zn ribbon protein